MIKILVIFLLFFAVECYALQKVQVQEVSRSGKSFIINRGSLDGLKSNQRAYFVETINQKTLKKSYLGKAIAARVFSKYSVWYFLSKSERPYNFKQKEFLDMFTTRESMRGRAPYRIGRKKIVGAKTKAGLAIKDDEFDEVEELELNTRASRKMDIEIFELHKWVSQGKNIYPEFNDTLEENIVLKTSSDIDPKKLETQAQRKEMREQVSAYTRQSEEDFSVESYYKGSQRVTERPEFSEDDDLISLDEEATEDSEIRKHKRKLMRQRVDNAPGDWSQSYSDRQLIEMVNYYGLNKEVKRRKNAWDNVISHELYFQLSTNLTETSKTTNNSSSANGDSSGTPYRIGVGYEYAFIRNSFAMRHWTFDSSFQYGNNNYDLANTVAVKEFFLKFGINWYFLRPPTVVKSLLPYVGIGYKFGQALADLNTTDYKYDLRGLQALAGLKYRLNNDYGMRVHISFENTNLKLRDEEVNQIVKKDESFVYYNIEAAFSYFF